MCEMRGQRAIPTGDLGLSGALRRACPCVRARAIHKKQFHCGATESSGRGVHSVKSTRGCIYPPHTPHSSQGRITWVDPPSSPTAVNASDRSTIELFSNFSPHPRRRHSQTTTSSHLAAAPSPPTPPTPSPLVPVGQDEAGPTPTSWRPASRWPRAAATTATAAGARRRRSRGRSPEERRLA